MAGIQNEPQFKIARDAYVPHGTFHNAERDQMVNNGPVTVYYGNDNGLQKLIDQSAPDAIHTSATVYDQGTCTAGTREKTLERIHSFVTSSDSASSDLIWMHGPAGAGKSAIMRTTAQRLDEAGTLLASFFFFRSEDRRKNSAHFIPTLALQVSEKLPQAVNAITHSLRQNHTLFSQPPHLQCLPLLQTPLINLLASPDAQSRWSSTSPHVIVVDGLDECMDDGGQEKVIKALVQLASAIRSDTNCRIKIVVASRPEVRIKTKFDRLRANNKATVIRLDSSDAKLHLFYAERLAKIREKYPGLGDWPSEEDWEWLMDKTSGQYSFADVSTRHLAGGDPVHRLQDIRQAFATFKHDGNPFEPLDLVYATVLNQIPSEMRQNALHVLRLRLGKVPRWIPFSVYIVEPLLQLSEGFISRLSSHLSSLIDFDNGLRPYHASLGDFLLNPPRLARFGLRIDESLFYKTIIKGLFAPVSPQTRTLSTREIKGFSYVIGDNTIVMPPSPMTCSPIHEFISLLNAVDLSLLDFWASCYFFHLCKAIRSAGLFKQAPPFGWKLWYRVSLSSPRRMKAIWLDKVALYGQGQGVTNVAELAIGLLVLFQKHTEKIFRSVQDVIRGSGPLSNIDETHQWNLSHVADYADRTVASLLMDRALLEIQGARHTLKCVQIALREMLRAGNDSGHMHPIIAGFVACHTGHSTDADGIDVRLGCGGCSSNLASLKSEAVKAWLHLPQYRRIPILVLDTDLSLLDMLHTWVQGNEIHPDVVHHMICEFTDHLRSWRESLTPSFASSQKRKLQGLCVALRAQLAALEEGQKPRGDPRTSIYYDDELDRIKFRLDALNRTRDSIRRSAPLPRVITRAVYFSIVFCIIAVCAHACFR